ncbi:MAG TPA: hypothetical protein VM677_27390 [Actinokineospora sp.]|nr:hypothetical protein [Actinokineospora sp.]
MDIDPHLAVRHGGGLPVRAVAVAGTRVGDGDLGGVADGAHALDPDPVTAGVCHCTFIAPPAELYERASSMARPSSVVRT